MKKRKLPSNYKVQFISKGDFITCITDLIAEDRALIPDNRQIFRSSRYDIKDFQVFINERYQGEKILFADDFWHKTWKDEYIIANSDFDKEGIKALLEILNIPVLYFFELAFSGLSIWRFEASGKSTRTFNREFIPKQNTYNLNNLYFDPYIDLNGNDLDKHFMMFFQRALEDIRINPNLDIVFGGEFVWANDISCYISSLVNLDDLQSAKFYLDYSGLFQGLVSDSGSSTKLALLHRDFFIPDLVYSSKVPEKPGEIFKKGVANRVQFEKNALNLIGVEASEVCDDFEFRQKTGILLYGKGELKVIKSSNRLTPIISQAEIIIRPDKVVQYYDEEIQFHRKDRKVKFLKIFDYHQVDAIKNVRLKVVDGEYVNTKQEICRYLKTGSLLEKRFFSSVEGVIDLSEMSLGYIIIRQSKEKQVKVRNQAYVKIRSRAIFGKEVYGVLGEDVFYVPNLDKESFEKCIQEGGKSIVCRTIDQEMFNAVIEYNLSKLLTICIIDGIGFKTKGDFVFEGFSGFNIYLNEKSNSVFVGLPQKRGNFYQNCKTPNETLFRIGSEVRLINRDHWGEYARIVGVDNIGSKIQIKGNKKSSESSIINII